MKKKFLIMLICFMQLCLVCFGEETQWRSLIEYKSPATLIALRMEGYNFIRFAIGGTKTDEISFFDLANSDFSDEDAVQLIKTIRLETYDLGGYLDHDTAVAHMNSYIINYLIDKYGYAYISKVNYEFSLDDIDKHDGNFTSYFYKLNLKRK